MELIDKAAVKAIIGRMQDCTMDEDGNFYSSSALAEYNILCDIENRLDTLEVKEVDLDIKQRMEECPYRQIGCTMYNGHILECRGACSWIVDYPKLKELKLQKEE